MTEELNKELVKILQDTTETIGSAKDFVIGELPDVVSQLLLWYWVHSAILMAIGLILLVALPIFSVKTWDTSWTHRDDNGTRDVGPVIIVWAILQVTVLFASLALMNLTWLKIWIAPKIWLIEYTATLVKG